MQISEPGKELKERSLLLAADSGMLKVTEQKGHQEPAFLSGGAEMHHWGALGHTTAVGKDWGQRLHAGIPVCKEA